MVYQRQCQRMGCSNLIDPKHRTKKFCSDKCRQKDGREIRELLRKNKPPVLCQQCRCALEGKKCPGK